MAPIRRSPMAPALALVLISLLVLGLPVPVGEAAKDASISITADKHTVDVGDTVTLHIRLHNIENAALDGDPLSGNKIDMRVLICKTRTYTVTGQTADGANLTRSLTIKAKGVAADVTGKPCRLIILDSAPTPDQSNSGDPGSP
jgi:hypothetical protein